MANSLPLFERKKQNRMILRIVELLVLFLLLSLLAYHLISLKWHGTPGLLAFICECSFTFNWILCVNIKWNQFRCISYPKRLLQQFQKSELPAVDMFVTTADVELEPPILTMNTVLSLLAVDYPAHKLACYVSDDGASPLTYYSLVETSRFAQIWVPFCKKYEIRVRAPFRYFTRSCKPSEEQPLEFQKEWKSVKDKYQVLCRKIENASQTFVPSEIFAKMDRKNHPTITKVIMEESVVPRLVYISREKDPKHPHHFKAGAMNVLTRVSGLMTNAPFIMNVDCDMHVNNPQVILHAMCMLLGVKNEKDCAFVQFSQSFYDGLKDDPFGNQLVVMLENIGNGLAGIQGPLYYGTNCFHRRKVIYGLSPDYSATTEDDTTMRKKFGKSLEFIKSASQLLLGTVKGDKGGLWSSIEAANQVAGCGYEYGTLWGTKVGWMYGSATEDVLTGLAIQGRGWRSMSCFTDPPSFLGCAPNDGPSSMTQMKRWSTGLLELLFTSKSPILVTINGKLQFRQCLAYMCLSTRALRSIPELVYALLPAYCIITNSHFLPKLDEPAILIPVTLLVVYKVYTLSEYLLMRQSIRSWWNNQRMTRINCTSSCFFGLISVILKLLGLSQTVFEVTKKKQGQDYEDEPSTNSGSFTFDKSPIFVPGMTVLLVNLTALFVGVVGFQPSVDSVGVGIGEKVCASLVVLYFWPFLKGSFGIGKYGLPVSTICKSGALALSFMLYFKCS